MGLGAYFVYLGWLGQQQQQRKMITQDIGTPEQLPESSPKTDDLTWEEFCKNNPLDICTEDKRPDDFLYEEPDVSIVKPEEANVKELQHLVGEVSIEEPAPPAEIPPQKEITPPAEAPSLKEKSTEILAIADELNQEALDILYEEPLSENVIGEETSTQQPEQDLIEPDTEFTHIYDKDIKALRITPVHKPPYFGKLPVLAVVIDDMGISQMRTKDIISLKAPLTASFLTYGKNLEEQVNHSRAAGHEIMIHTPMEAQNPVDTAPDVLTTRMTSEEIQQNLKVMLDKFHDVKGINNHMGSKLTEDKVRMLAVMEILKERGLFFLDSKTSAKSKAEEAAAESGIAYAHRHVFIDNNNNKEYILGQLSKAENVARKNGYAIAIGHPKTQTYAALKEWIGTLDDKKLKLTHLSEIVKVLNP